MLRPLRARAFRYIYIYIYRQDRGGSFPGKGKNPSKTRAGALPSQIVSCLMGRNASRCTRALWECAKTLNYLQIWCSFDHAGCSDVLLLNMPEIKSNAYRRRALGTSLFFREVQAIFFF